MILQRAEDLKVLVVILCALNNLITLWNIFMILHSYAEIGHDSLSCIWMKTFAHKFSEEFYFFLQSGMMVWSKC